MKHPDLPEGVFDEWDVDLDQLWLDIMQELLAPEFLTRNHMSHRTYDNGCRGPACKRANRMRTRRRQQYQLNDSKYTFTDEVIEAWVPIAIKMIREAMEDMKAKLLA